MNNKNESLDNISERRDLNSAGSDFLYLETPLLSTFLDEILNAKDLASKRKKVAELKVDSISSQTDSEDTTVISRASFESQLDQMTKSRTKERLDYYAKRLKRSLTEIRSPDYSDINLRRWREYQHIKTDSLWILRKRGKGEGEDASYWGNFVPEIPQQLIERYTREGEWVLDPFLGSGTTMVESFKLGRKCIGIDINRSATSLVEKKMRQLAENKHSDYKILTMDSRLISRTVLEQNAGVETVQLAILHPPYHDIVQFSDLKEDLSNAETLNDFLDMFSDVMRAVDSILEAGRFLCIVIGDKYVNGELIPLSHLISQIALNMGFRFKGIVVKNFENTRGKRGSEMLWKYRALAGGFYVFKHEYILIFRKDLS